MLLREESLPETVYVVLEGDVDIYSKTGATVPASTSHRFMAKTMPGSKVLLQALSEQLGKLTVVHQASQEGLFSVGAECLVLSLSSPQTYVCRSEGYALALDAKTFGKEILSLTPEVIESIQSKFNKRLAQLTAASMEKHSKVAEA